ncbi:hypothetical protein NKI61_19835 [Mesorhizobium sp. M0514]|uniref:hypothetical protein n=1 Tax=Mesorhizobium sp. M0514 TaxID=2956955 RepID=UPI00333D4944
MLAVRPYRALGAEVGPMTARGYKFFAWSFLCGAAWAWLENVDITVVLGLIIVSTVHMAASDILKAVGK